MNLLSLNDMSLKEAALTYAEMGWYVLPLRVNDKRPATKNGLLDASIDFNAIEDWWLSNPQYNIGLLTGSRFDALDLDGDEAVKAFYNMHPGYEHSGPVQETGKGYHLLFKASGSSNHAKIQNHPIDYRGLRGYIVAAPSYHNDKKKRYRWIKDGDLPEVPTWFRPVLFPTVNGIGKGGKDRPDYIKAAIEQEKDIVAIFREIGLEPKQHGGSKMVLHCPFHEGDNQASLVIYLKTNSFLCWGCMRFGDPVNVRRWINTGHLPPKTGS